jgi:hypothetical protein
MSRPLPAPTGEDEPIERVLERLREESRRWARREGERPRVSSGVTRLDALLAGGWSPGRIAELVGPGSSGRTSVAVATVAAATSRGEVVAWIDAGDAFDPASAAEAGVALDRILWVRPGNVEQAVRAAELVLAVGGFTVVVVDLAEPAVLSGRRENRERERRAALRLRLARAVERAQAVGLVLAERPWAEAVAGVSLRLERGRPLWSGGEQGAPRWLDGIGLLVQAERGGARDARASGHAFSRGAERAAGA